MLSKNLKKTEIEMDIWSVFIGITTKVSSLLSTFWGWLMTTIVVWGTYFLGIKMLIWILFGCLVVDLVLGLAVTIKTKGIKGILSSKLRNTLVKASFYLFSMTISYAAEKEVGSDYLILSKLIFSIAVLTELFSSAALCLVLNPEFVFLRIFKKYMTDEISKKLNVTPEEVNDLLTVEMKIKEEKKPDTEL